MSRYKKQGLEKREKQDVEERETEERQVGQEWNKPVKNEWQKGGKEMGTVVLLFSFPRVENCTKQYDFFPWWHNLE